MRNKSHWLFLAPFLFLFGCEEVIEVPLQSVAPRLVVDALIAYDSTNPESEFTVGNVTLTLTADFYDDGVPVARNATVRLRDGVTGQIFPFTESNPGVFTEILPPLEFGRDYTLEVEYNGETYRATEQLEPTGRIESVEQGDRFLFDEEEETEIVVTFSDIPNERNFYLFAFGFSNYLVTDDEFYQDQSLTFSYFYENIDPGDTLNIALLGIDSEFASYADQVLVQSGENGGGGFGVAPSTVRGNVINVTDPENFPFGYFSMSETNRATITIE